MKRVNPILAALLLAGFAVAFSWKYLQTYGRAEQSPASVGLVSPAVPLSAPYAREVLVSGMAKQISEAVQLYHDTHGHFPPVDGFWTEIGIAPLHNPINGLDTVAPVSDDRNTDYSAVGWVYLERGGMVFPGAVFNASRPSRPSTRPE